MTLTELLTWLNSPAFTAFSEPTSWAELIGFVLGIASTWLACTESLWTWPYSIANNVVWIPLFAQKHLWADTGLQFVYLAIGVIGLWHWMRPAASKQDELPVTRTPQWEWYAQAAVLVFGTWWLWAFLAGHDDGAPFPDASSTVLACVAMWAQARKYIETWPLWVAVDLITIPMYFAKGLPLTALLSIIFLLFAVRGWVFWARSMRESETAFAAA